MYHLAVTLIRLEILVEPFKENEPGPHVQAVLSALEDAGIKTDMGPFSTTAVAEIDVVAAALGDVIRSGIATGATALQLRVELADV